MSNRGLFVAIEGIISCGKSTFAPALAGHLAANGTPAIYQAEPVAANPFLVRFSGKDGDMKRWAYTMQVHLLHARYRMHQQAAVSNDVVVQDRSIYGDVCFAQLAHKLGNMDNEEFASYEQARENMLLHMVYPDLVIYLDLSAEQALARMKRRQQTGDDGLWVGYLRGLRTEYEAMLANLGTHCPVFRVAWTDFSDDQIADRVADTWAVAKDRLRDDWTRRQGW